MSFTVEVKDFKQVQNILVAVNSLMVEIDESDNPIKTSGNYLKLKQSVAELGRREYDKQLK